MRCCSVSSTCALHVVIATISPASWASFRVLRCTKLGKTRVIGRTLGLLISNIGISQRRWDQQNVWHAHHRSTRWHWNLMWLGALGRFGVVVCAAAPPDVCLEHGLFDICRRTGLHVSRPSWFHRWRWRFHNAPWLSWSSMRQTRWSPSHTQQHLNLVSCTWRHSSEASPDHVH